MTDEPEWWRGASPPDQLPSEWPNFREFTTGRHTGALATPPLVPGLGLRQRFFFRAQVSDVELSLTDAQLGVAWSEFDRCLFTQRVRPVLNEHGIAAQGSWGIRASIYRDCVFDRVRFKTLGGFTLSAARFENCTFRNCRWEGHFAHSCDLVDCVFIGKMTGCVWFGEDREGRSPPRVNDIRGNDFTDTTFSNVGWRFDFPVADQIWPEGHLPRADQPRG